MKIVKSIKSNYSKERETMSHKQEWRDMIVLQKNEYYAEFTRESKAFYPW